MYDPEVKARVAQILERLADGESVELGDFSDNASPTTHADEEAEYLRWLADAQPEPAL